MKNDIEEARRKLLEDYQLKPGKKLYTIVTNVSQGGVNRSIMVLMAGLDEHQLPAIFDISWLVAQTGLGHFDRKYGGVKIRGIGVDMEFRIIYELGRILYPHGFDTDGYYPDKDRKYWRNAEVDFELDGGYAFQKASL